jgi:hypothetical protein
VNVVITGSQNLADCSCGKETHWPPTPEEQIHVEECARVGAWLLMLAIVTRLAKREGVVIMSGMDLGADRLAEDAAKMLNLPYKLLEAKRRKGEWWDRMADSVEAKADELIGVFRAGTIPYGPATMIERARAKGVPVHIWHGGTWT